MKKNSKKKVATNQPKPVASHLYNSSKTYRPLKSYIAFSQFNQDHNLNVNEYDLALIRSRARDLYANTPAIRNAIAEIADFAVGDAWLLKSTSQDKEYKDAVESFVNKNWIPLVEWHKTLRLAIKSVLRDGDFLFTLTKSADGTYPKIQLIPAHKIGNGKNLYNGTVEDGPYKGYNICKGVILNDNGEPIAYNLVNPNQPDQQISVLNCRLVSETDNIDQLRGESALKDCVNIWEDINTVISFELQGIKTAASKALIINAPTNQVAGLANMDDNNPLETTAVETTETGKTVSVKQSELRGGEVIVFDNTQGGGEMKQVDTNRPTQNVQAFIEERVRHAMLCLRWPIEFSVNLDMSGATAKTTIQKIQRRIAEVQQMILLPVWRRVMPYVIAVAAKNGYIPRHVDWLKIEPTYPKSFSYEQLKDTKSDLEMYNKGILTATQICAAEGYDYKDNLTEKADELEFRNKLAAERNINPNDLVLITPNGNSTPPASPTPQQQQQN